MIASRLSIDTFESSILNNASRIPSCDILNRANMIATQPISFHPPPKRDDVQILLARASPSRETTRSFVPLEGFEGGLTSAPIEKSASRSGRSRAVVVSISDQIEVPRTSEEILFQKKGCFSKNQHRARKEGGTRTHLHLLLRRCARRNDPWRRSRRHRLERTMSDKWRSGGARLSNRAEERQSRSHHLAIRSSRLGSLLGDTSEERQRRSPRSILLRFFRRVERAGNGG